MSYISDVLHSTLGTQSLSFLLVVVCQLEGVSNWCISLLTSTHRSCISIIMQETIVSLSLFEIGICLVALVMCIHSSSYDIGFIRPEDLEGASNV